MSAAQIESAINELRAVQHEIFVFQCAHRNGSETKPSESTTSLRKRALVQSQLDALNRRMDRIRMMIDHLYNYGPTDNGVEGVSIETIVPPRKLSYQ